MTSMYFRNLLNIDDAHSLDTSFWYTEVRGLSLDKLDAEATAESCEGFLEWAQPALRALFEEGTATRAEYNRLNPRYVDPWEASFVCGHLHYVAQKYRNLKKLVEEAQSKLDIALDMLKDDVEESCYEPVDDSDEWNKIHFLGCIQWADIAYDKMVSLRKRGKLPAGPNMVRMFRVIEKKYHNREVVRTDYLRICGTLATWLEWKNVAKKMLDEYNERIANKTPRWVGMPVEESEYSLSMEDYIDVKMAAERLSERHNISLEQAMYSILEERGL